eukprot:4550341-Pleurochrysis_carterae.AAC.1
MSQLLVLTIRKHQLATNKKSQRYAPLSSQYISKILHQLKLCLCHHLRTHQLVQQAIALQSQGKA